MPPILFTDRAGGELNAHLSERLNHHSGDTHVDLMPIVPMRRANNDIREYYTDVPLDKPAGWIAKPEIPSPQEIMAPTYLNNDDILIDVGDKLRPNKAQGAYESKEEYLGTQYGT